MIERKWTRLPAEEWTAPFRLSECSPSCPSGGHSVRLDEPGYVGADFQADARVRLLHALMDAMGTLDCLVGQADVKNALMDIATVTILADNQASDRSTHEQGGRIVGALIRRNARMLTQRLNEIRRTAYNDGWTAGFHAALK